VARKFKGNGDKRDGKRFVALPVAVLDSPGYRQASYPARALLTDIAMQYFGHNNGKLTACAKYLTPKGWTSNNTVLRAVHELQACGLLIEVRKGARPNKAAWFALSWCDLDQGIGLDIDPKQYRRGAYMTPEKVAPTGDASLRTAKATEARKLAALRKREANQNASLTPSSGSTKARIAPSNGVRPSIVAPCDGAIRGTSEPTSTPCNGAYLEAPSTPVATGSVRSVTALSPSLVAALKRTAAGVAS
jgi:hypothetical protein